MQAFDKYMSALRRKFKGAKAFNYTSESARVYRWQRDAVCSFTQLPITHLPSGHPSLFSKTRNVLAARQLVKLMNGEIDLQLQQSRTRTHISATRTPLESP